MQSKVLLFYETDNATDGVINIGCKNVLNKALGDVQYFDLKKSMETIDFFDLSEDDCLPNEKFDYIVIPGTPWLWHKNTFSKKWGNLERVLHTHPEARKVFLGIGSCYTIGFDPDLLYEQKAVGRFQTVFKDTLVIVRDKLARHVLESYNIKSHLLMCPSYLCYSGGNYYGIDLMSYVRSSSAVFIDPRTSISKVGWDDEKFEKYMQIFQYFIHEYSQPCIYIAPNSTKQYETDSKLLRKFGLDFTVLNTYKDTLLMALTSSCVLSGRVHCAVPAATLGVPTGIIPIDSRARTLTDFDVCEVNSPDDFDNIKGINMNHEELMSQYVSLIRCM